MNKNNTVIGVLVLLALGLGGFFLFVRGSGQEAAVPDLGMVAGEETADELVEQSEVVETQTYTLTQVFRHNSKEDCWIAMEGKVYDVTPFIASGNHPGGEAILAGCGTDATELYNTRPMGSGTPHSERARSFLPDFYIGDLVE